jgi:hypothetical protein
MPLPGSLHPYMVTQPFVFVPLSLPYAWAVASASPAPMRMPCITSFRTVLELKSVKKNKRMRNTTHTTPTMAIK